ncbi:hypothetical protein G3T36_18095 [Diaminobutyricibacter tongyongensis]|uniref:Uncharacterized protein n=1 Tax=Leifsonia tongyongensis TaxID=1268043 RepID=A0A6L9Y257_9MICO|nr:hypothetical protein [Diaminobutyricibacter tongyongensis]NEN07771.1 hypothetical protein [Diaminobutyricibacter tongyongensis]
MPQTIFDTDSAVLTFKERKWHVRRCETYEWAISSPGGEPVGTLRCIVKAGPEGDPIFSLALPGIKEDTPTTGSDWFSIIEYAINEYLDKEDINGEVI